MQVPPKGTREAYLNRCRGKLRAGVTALQQASLPECCRVSSCGHFSEAQAARVVHQLLSGVAYLHSHGTAFLPACGLC